MFKNPDRDQAMENLKKLATRLNVALPEIPRFLEDYSDIFLSLAYFKHCLDTIAPSIREFLESMEELRGNFLIKNDTNFVKTSLFVENTLNNVTASITGRFESFQRHSNEMWSDINAESFSRVKRIISSHHSTIGGVLCGLAGKMSMWNDRFADGREGPQARRISCSPRCARDRKDCRSRSFRAESLRLVRLTSLLAGRHTRKAPHLARRSVAI